MTLEVVPANRVSCRVLDELFESSRPAAECRCQRYRLSRGESFRNTPEADRTARLHAQTRYGQAKADITSGLVALEGRAAVGWCAVAPRAIYDGLLRNSQMAAWSGRNENRLDPTVWSVNCVFVRPGFRRAGVAQALIEAAIGFARDRGAARLEAYPIVEHSAVGTEDHPGLLIQYQRAGFAEVHAPSSRRRVVAIDFSRPGAGSGHS